MAEPPRNIPKTIGRYDVVQWIGGGGMGVVYRCRDPKIGRSVAIKLLRIADEGLSSRFLQEAAIAGNLEHGNIVTIYDYGEHEGQPFIVMQFVEGVTLGEHIASGLQFSLSRTLEILEELCAGLGYAHSRGVVHRDIKPANIMIDRRDVVRILDFGIARVSNSTMTVDGAMLGTPNYMSPEQIVGGHVDGRSDIFSTGLVFYELLSHQQAFSGESMHAVITAIPRDEPTPLRTLRPELDPAIEAIVARAIQKDPAARYQTMHAFGADVARARRALTDRSAARADETRIIVPPAPPARPTPRPGPRRDIVKRREETIEAHLQNARRAFDADQFENAVEECERAAILDPNDTRILDLLDRARDASEARRIGALLDEARALVEARKRDDARECIERALQIDPSHAAALALRASIDEAERAARERDAAVRRALARSEESFASGNPESAIRAASEVLVHDPTNARAHELQREAFRQLEERRRRAAIDAAAQAVVDAQKKEFAGGRRREAIAALEGVTPVHELITAAAANLRRELEAIEAREAEAEARRRQAETEAEQRQQAQLRWASRQMELASGALEAGQFADALEILQHVEQVAPDLPDLARLRAAAQTAKQAADAELERQHEIAGLLTTAERAESAGQLAEASSLVERALAREPGHAGAAALRARIDAADDARREQRERDQAASAVVDAARAQFERGDHAGALASLEAWAPPHALTAKALGELRARIVQIERDNEARRQAEDADRRIDAAEAALKAGDFAAAEDALREAAALDPHNHRLSGARIQIQQGRDAERLREKRRRQEQERYQKVAAKARRLFASGKEDAALSLLQETVAAAAPGTDSADAALRRVLEDTLAELSAQRRARAAKKDEEAGRTATDGTVTERAGISAAAIALVVMGLVAGGWLIYRSYAGSGAGGRHTSVVSIPPSTSTATSTATPTTTPTTTPSIPSTIRPDVNVNAIVANVRQLVASGALVAAASAAVGGLGQAPDAAPIRDALENVFRMAESRLSAAKAAADTANASQRPEYTEAARRAQAAQSLRRTARPQDAEKSVSGFVEAATLYADAAKAQLAQPTTTVTVTVIPAATTSSVPPRTSTIVTTAPSTAPTTMPIGPDVATVTRVLSAYRAAYHDLDVASIRKVFPKLPTNIQTRVEALKRMYRSCDLEFSNVRIVTSTGTSATVQADARESCDAGIGRTPPASTFAYRMDFAKDPSGAWSLDDMFFR